MENKIVLVFVFLVIMAGSMTAETDTKCSLDMVKLENCVLNKSQLLGQYLNKEGYDPLTIDEMDVKYRVIKGNLKSVSIAGLKDIRPQTIKIQKKLMEAKYSVSASMKADLDISLAFLIHFKGKLSAKFDNVTISLASKLAENPLHLESSSSGVELGETSISVSPSAGTSSLTQAMVETFIKRRGKDFIEANKGQIESRLTEILEKSLNDILQR